MPSWTARIAAIRPRGDADSSPVRRYVGQCGRHSPQATQSLRSASEGAARLARHAGAAIGEPMKRAPSGSSLPNGSACARSAMTAMLRHPLGLPLMHEPPRRDVLETFEADSDVSPLEGGEW